MITDWAMCRWLKITYSCIQSLLTKQNGVKYSFDISQIVHFLFLFSWISNRAVTSIFTDNHLTCKILATPRLFSVLMVTFYFANFVIKSHFQVFLKVWMMFFLLKIDSDIRFGTQLINKTQMTTGQMINYNFKV